MSASWDTFVEYGRGERLADFAIHTIGVTLGTVAAGHLAIVALSEPLPLAIGFVVYSASLLAMLICSGLYNVASPSPRKTFLRRLDHAAIYVMIAGTYTPFTLDLASRTAGLALLLFVWIVAAVGVALKLAYPRRYETAALVLYLALGWCFLAVAHAFFAVLTDSAGALLLCGGILYTGGVAIHHWRRLRYHNALWHAVVLVATGCHYAAVLSLTG
jgi:hemolysin III